MIQSKQNLFQGFSTSIDQNQLQPQRPQQQIHDRPCRKQKRASTYTKLVQKNFSLDPSQLQDYNLQLHKSFHMFKKCVSSEEIFYGKTTEEELYKLLYEYLNEVIENPLILNKQINSMHFQQENNYNLNQNNNQQQPNTNNLQSSLQISTTSKPYSHLSRIFTQNNLAKSVSIQFQRSNNSGVKNSSGVSLTKRNSSSAMSLGKQMQEQYVSRAIASIEQVESEKMEDSVKFISDSMKLIDIKEEESINEEINVQEQQQQNQQEEEDYIIDNTQSCPTRKQANISIKMMDNEYIQKRRNNKLSIKMMQNTSTHRMDNNLSIKMMDNSSSDKKMKNSSDNKIQNSATSFGFQFDTSLGKDLLHQVSLLYLNNHSIRNQRSQVSLSIRDSTGGESSWFSETSSDSMSLDDVVERIKITLNLQFLTRLYYEPEPFLVTISLIYLLKYLYHSAHILTEQSSPILLATSLLVSYKIYEDQPIAGLVEYLVDDVLEKKITKDQMVKFQRHFLQTIGYEVVIGNQQFYKMLAIVKGEAVVK